MLDTSIKIKTDRFDGPLALLLLLTQKEEMNVRDLNITVITAQYLAYLSKMKELNFDIAGDFLYLASTLLLIKSKACLNEEDTPVLDQEDALGITSQADLINRLEKLEHFQRLGKRLWALPKKGHEIFTKPKVNKKVIINSILTPLELDKLTLSMIDLIKKNRRKFTIIKKDRLSIKDKLLLFKRHLQVGQSLDFNYLINLSEDESISNIVVSFISILELARLKKIKIFQRKNNSTIYIDVLESLENFDVSLANGFMEEPENAPNNV